MTEERDCNHCEHYDPMNGECLNSQADWYGANRYGWEECSMFEKWDPEKLLEKYRKEGKA